MTVKFFSVLIISFSLAVFSCAGKNRLTSSHDGSAPGLAFPEAEGFGKYATGGRGGKVMIVSNLNDAGPGSFRQAVENNKPKIVVFAISGTIHLNSKLSIKSNTTIAGQTAPGDGVCLADYPVSLAGNNIVIRFMRFRMGDKNQKGGMVDGNGGDDAFGGTHRNNIIIDHCSISWSTDEVFSVYGGDSTTLSWNLISEPLNYSYHFESGDKDFEHHGYGGIWGGRHTSGHHNLFAHCANRTPRFDGIRNIPEEFVDFRNNVIYDWANNNVYAGEGGHYNLVNNYYKWGPSTKENVKSRVFNPYKTEKIPFGKFYIDGNYVDASATVSNNNWLGVVMEKGTDEDAKTSKVETPFPAESITTQSATVAYTQVLKNVGAILPKRDTLDERIINDVKNRKGGLIDVQGGYPHGTDYSLTTHAWPTLQSAPAVIDSDSDGLPDSWEVKNKLNPKDGSDASKTSIDNRYTNIEVYINSLVK
jgi:hypothetical protein